MADLSTAALQTVKDALKTFQTDMEGFSLRASDASTEIKESCRTRLVRQKEILPKPSWKLQRWNNRFLVWNQKLRKQPTNITLSRQVFRVYKVAFNLLRQRLTH